MNLFLKLAFLFATGSLIGWTIELFFRRYFDPTNPERKWVNPGFLIGPYLPLYGFSLMILYLLAQLEDYVDIQTDWLRKLVLFAIMAICITALEYFTGLIFIVKLKIKLWDYTENRFNIKGIICPLYSFFWMLLSGFYYFFIDPFIQSGLDWLARNLAFSFVVGFFYGVFFIDLAISIKEMIKIHIFANENEMIIFIEELKEQIRVYKEQRHEKHSFLRSLRSSDTLQNHLARYKEHEDEGKLSLSKLINRNRN